jgi:uncharacterized protein
MRNRRKNLFPAAALAAGTALILMLSLFAAEKPEDVPNPLTTQGRYVGDNASILGPEYIALIDGLCKRLKDATTAEMAVITVKDLGGTTVEDFAERLFRRFGIGVKGKDNGVLVLCSLGERAVRIEVGYGLEPVLTDAVTSRILDEEAVPFLAKNEFGRGLYALARAAAMKIAAAQGIPLEMSDPASWPVQPVFTPAEVKSSGNEAEPADGSPRNAPLILAGLAAFLGLLGLGSVYRKYEKARGKAIRASVISQANGLTALLWTGSVVGWIVLIVNRIPFLASSLSLLSPAGVTIGLGFFRRMLRRRLESYRLPCSQCGTAMDLTPEDMDDALLAVEEAAEEKAGGMNYEVWTCPSCRFQERFSVKLHGAGECPKCGRRTLKQTSTTLVAATTAHGGKVRIDRRCLNPNCGFSDSREDSTPRLSPPSSSSGSSGSRSSSSGSRSSFGGGRSGGGGASRRF